MPELRYTTSDYEELLDEKPAPVLRTDVANICGDERPDYLFSELIDRPVEQALSLDAACVVVNVLLLEDAPDRRPPCLSSERRRVEASL